MCNRSVIAGLVAAIAIAIAAGPTAAQQVINTPSADPAPSAESEPVAVDDTAVEEALRSALHSLEGFDAVTVEVDAGVARLSGEVSTLRLWRQAEQLALATEGVTAVVNDVEIATDVREQVDALRDTASRAATFAPIVGFAIAVLLLFIGLSWLVGKWDSLFSRIAPNRFVQDMLRSTIRVALVLTGVVLALHIVDATAIAGALVGTAGVAGIALGFAFKDLVENYMASVLLSLRQPFEPNDHVDIDGFEGKVVRLTSRATVLMTLDGNHVRIPNARVFKGVILNYTRNPNRRFDFAIGVATDADLAAAQETGVEVLNRMPGVLDDPAPSSVIVEVGDSSVPIRFFGWVNQQATDFGQARSEAIRLVKEQLEHAGIELPEPIYRIRTEPMELPTPERPTSAPELELRSDIARRGDPIIEQIDAEREASDTGDLLDRAAPKE